jgi:hypothetical protein
MEISESKIGAAHDRAVASHAREHSFEDTGIGDCLEIEDAELMRDRVPLDIDVARRRVFEEAVEIRITLLGT